jgi:N-methylhydantoinase B
MASKTKTVQNARAAAGNDPIMLEIYWSRAIAIANEMLATLMRTSFSTVIRINRDCSAAIFDERGQMLAQPDHSAPGHIGCMPGVMERILKKYPLASIEDGDSFITNDPWIGAGHSPDIYIASPVFKSKRLVGFCVTVAHHLDLGGRVGSTDSQDVFEEGLLIPLLKLYKKGKRNDDLFSMIEENVRMPHIVLGDLEAQMASNRIGATRMLELIDDYKLTGLVEVTDAITGTTEKAMRSAIRVIPNGVFEISETLELTDENGKPIIIKARIEIQDDQVVFDYAGTSLQVRRPVNSVLNYTITYCALALKFTLVPSLPYNDGIQRTLVVKAPEGSVLNPLRPAAVWRRTVLGMLLPDIIFKALAKAMPEKIIAGSGSCPMWLWLFSGWRPDLKRFVFQTHFMGGLGARFDSDGMHTAAFPFDATDSPMEILENACPVVVERRDLVTDSAGAGQYRGGLGQEITLSPAPEKLGVIKGALSISYSAGHLQNGPDGLDSGLAAPPGLIRINDTPVTNSLATIKINEGDKLTFRLPGGGGYHAPLGRSPDAVRQDVLDGFVSREAAQSVYGVVLTGESCEIDDAATEALRAAMRGAAALRADAHVSV